MKFSFGKCVVETVYQLAINRHQNEAIALKAMVYSENGEPIPKVKILKKMIFLLCNLIADLKRKSNNDQFRNGEYATELMNRCVELLEEFLEHEKA